MKTINQHILYATRAGLDCYDLLKEHDEHCFDFHESIEDEKLYNRIKKETGTGYGYMCYECIERFRGQLQ